MTFRHIGAAVAAVLVFCTVAVGSVQARDFSFTCNTDPSVEITLGTPIVEFATEIENLNAFGDSVEITVTPYLPDGWFWQVCQVSSGVCYFADVTVFVEDTDEFRVDFFPNTGTPGVGNIQIEVRSKADPLEVYHCSYAVFNGESEVDAQFDISCIDTIYSPTEETLYEFFADLTNPTAFDDSVTIVPENFFPAGWFGQFCQTSTGICYFGEATIELPAGFTETLRVDFFPQPGDDFAQTQLAVFSTNNPSEYTRCVYNVYQGATTDTPDGFQVPSTASSFAAPNPFRSGTAISFQLDQDVEADLTIYNADGREVRRLRDLRIPSGESNVTWDGQDAAGNHTPAGVYFYRLEGAPVEAKGLMVKSN